MCRALAPSCPGSSSQVLVVRGLENKWAMAKLVKQGPDVRRSCCPEGGGSLAQVPSPETPQAAPLDSDIFIPV